MLAFQSYRDIPLSDTDVELNLTWSFDEADPLNPVLSETINEVLKDAGSHLKNYAVQDPFGQAMIKPAVARKFKLQEDDFELFCGAGVSGLLFAIASAHSGKRVCIISDCYPDFPGWLDRYSAKITTELAEDTETVFIERPSFLANSDCDSIEGLSELLKEFGKPVIIDESNANYVEDSLSAVRLVPQYPNLIVLRGLSKGFGMGGLRFGYAVSGSGTKNLLHNCLPPLHNTSISLAIARSILSIPESMLEVQRVRIASSKRDFKDRLSSLGFPEPLSSYPAFPYMVFDPDRVRDHNVIVEELSNRGVLGKRHPIWSGNLDYLQRFSVPFNHDRMARLARMLTPSRSA